MDIMDSTDTPTGGLDQTTAASSHSSAALPLSVDQRDDFASPTNRTTYGGQQPTSSSSSTAFSSGSSAMDRMDAVAGIDEDAPNAMPTSTDDVMMPRIEFASHPSIRSNSSSVSAVSSSATPPTAQQVKDRAAEAMESAKAKASGAMEAARDKASDARDKAADMSESAKAKAADMKDSAKAKASDMSDRIEDTADSVKEKLEEGVEKMKDGGQRLMDSVKSGLQSAEKTVEDKYEQVKEDLSARREAHKPTAPVVKATISTQPTDTHPDASSMRDAHLHPGVASIPSHSNENRPATSNPFISDAHHNALIAGDAAHARAVADAAEPKDASAAGGAGGAGGLLRSMHDKLEEGVDAVKERVDGFMERNVRRENDEHLSAANVKDLPTLIDTSNTHNTSMVRAKMHPSHERTLRGHDQDD